ncbi:AAA family ATPase [Alcaligenes sp. GCM10023179]|uniref:AAA family ATPase n=1 Tax=Alcaligenes sp. GCM10023179 TaxID=3252633 RepID=UPI00360F9267
MLYLICGKIAAGKSTLAKKLSEQPKTVLISEDFWLANVYPGQIASLEDYARCSAQLRAAMAPHIAALLQAGMSVVLDFPSNTLATRAWARELIEKSAVADKLCKARLHARNASGEHPFETTEAQFDLFSSYFVAPQESEGFHIIRHQISE